MFQLMSGPPDSLQDFPISTATSWQGGEYRLLHALTPARGLGVTRLVGPSLPPCTLAPSVCHQLQGLAQGPLAEFGGRQGALLPLASLLCGKESQCA